MIRFALTTLAALGLVFAYLYGVVGSVPTPPGRKFTPPPDLLKLGAGRDIKILVLGTSLTSAGTWPVDLEFQVGSCAVGNVEIGRLARAGASSTWGLAALREHLASFAAPDLLIVEFSGNDASLAKGVPLFLSRRTHREIIRYARETGIPVILATMSPAWGRNALERPGQDRYHALYRDLAVSEGVGLLDTIGDWRALGTDTRHRLVPDGLHPTTSGMTEVALPVFVESLRPFVCPE